MMRRRTIGAFWRTFGPYLTEIIASVLKLTSDMRMIVSLVNCYLTIPNGAKANGFFLPPTPPHMCAVHTQSRFSVEHHLSTFPQNYVNNDEFVV